MSPNQLTIIFAVLLSACGGLPTNRDGSEIHPDHRSSVIVFPGDELDSVSTRFDGDRTRWTGRRVQTRQRFYFPDEEPVLSPERKAETSAVHVEPSVTPQEPTRAAQTEGTTSQSTGHHSHPKHDWRPAKSEETRTPKDAVDKDTSSTQRSGHTIIVPNANARPSHTLSPPSSIIHFEERPTRVQPFPLPECGGKVYHAYHNATGDCQKVLTTKGCPDGFWFVLDYHSGAAGCRPRPCRSGQVLFKGACHILPPATTNRRRTSPNKPRDTNQNANNTDIDVHTSQLCPEGMLMYVNEYGRGTCDCAVRQVFWPSHGRCHPVYRRGPCSAGEQLMLEPVHPGSGEIQRPRCLPSQCPDGQVFWTHKNSSLSQTTSHVEVHQGKPASAMADGEEDEVTESTNQSTPHVEAHQGEPASAVAGGEEDEVTVSTGSCYPLDSDVDTSNGTGNPCSGGRLVVNSYTLQLECRPLVFNAIFNPPQVRCAPGSMLDFQGVCREKLRQKFRSFFVDTGSLIGRSLCPVGFIMTPNQRCVNATLTGLG